MRELFKFLHPLERVGFLGLLICATILVFGFFLPVIGVSPTTMKAFLFSILILTILFGVVLLMGADKRVAEQRKRITENMKGIITSLEGMRNNLHSAAGKIRDKPKDPPPGISN